MMDHFTPRGEPTWVLLPWKHSLVAWVLLVLVMSLWLKVLLLKSMVGQVFIFSWVCIFSHAAKAVPASPCTSSGLACIYGCAGLPVREDPGIIPQLQNGGNATLQRWRRTVGGSLLR